MNGRKYDKNYFMCIIYHFMLIEYISTLAWILLSKQNCEKI